MIIRRALPLMAVILVLVLLMANAPLGAADDNRVALVVAFSDDEVATRCVSFPEESITGYEALQRAGLAFETEIQAGGAAMCSIEGRGCPVDDCFCSCPGGADCVYWSYWHQIDGEWAYSVAGSGLYRVSDGAVEGWVWGPGAVSQAPPPPPVSFGDVCADEILASSAGSTVAPDDAITAEAGMAAGRNEQHAEGRQPYAGYAGLLLLLGVLAGVVYRRRRISHKEL